MTRKEFVAIADTIANLQVSKAARKRIAEDFAATCAREHRGGYYQFDRDRFMVRCGVG
jgi:hypothetical protein